MSSSDVFLLSWGCEEKKKKKAGVTSVLWNRPREVFTWVGVSRSSRPTSVPTVRKVMQPRDSSKSSLMKSQGSHGARGQHFNATHINARDPKILNNYCITAVFIPKFGRVKCGLRFVLSAPSALAPAGVSLM